MVAAGVAKAKADHITISGKDTLSSLLINPPTLLTHLINPPYQPTLSSHHDFRGRWGYWRSRMDGCQRGRATLGTRLGGSTTNPGYQRLTIPRSFTNRRAPQGQPYQHTFSSHALSSTLSKHPLNTPSPHPLTHPSPLNTPSHPTLPSSHQQPS